MNLEPSSPPPYIDWWLDRWKLAFLLLLFVILLAWALFAPADASTATPISFCLPVQMML